MSPTGEFVARYAANGWLPRLVNGRCDWLGRCPSCQSAYLYNFMHPSNANKVTLYACPDCTYRKSAQDGDFNNHVRLSSQGRSLARL